MSCFEDLGIKRYINAHDTITKYGGSRMSADVKKAMDEISESFVDLTECQIVIGDKIAELTKNEACFIAGGAAAALQVAAAACIARGDDYTYSLLPNVLDSTPNEFIVMHGQHVCYDKSLETAGGKLVFVGDADTVLPYELEGHISKKTAAIFYCPARDFARASLDFEKTISIAQKHGVPVIVDAAAQLPPVENLWFFTSRGADMVIFSGGKTISGPQNSGLVLGKREYIDYCRKYGAPEHGVCRVAKCTKEDMIGLYVAVKNFIKDDYQSERNRILSFSESLISAISTLKLKTRIIPFGSVGQNYSRVVIELPNEIKAVDVAQKMKEKRVFIGANVLENSIYISMQNVNEKELSVINKALYDTLKVFLK